MEAVSEKIGHLYIVGCPELAMLTTDCQVTTPLKRLALRRSLTHCQLVIPELLASRLDLSNLN